MATFFITEELVWMPAGWAYDNVILEIANLLKVNQPELSQMFLDARRESNGGFLDVQNLGPDQIRSILDAARAAYAQAEQKGGAAFHDPTFFPGYMKQFQTLIG